MGRKPPTDQPDDDELIFQDLIPEKPINIVQKSILWVQRRWTSQKAQSHQLLWLALPSMLLLFFLAFEIIHVFMPPNNATNVVNKSNTAIGMTITKIIPYDNILYVGLMQPTVETNILEAINAQNGTLVWSYTQQNVQEFELVANTLYIQTDTNMIALNARNRTTIWTQVMPYNEGDFQIDQNILITAATNSTIVALNAQTGAQLWKMDQQEEIWHIDNGIFYLQSFVTPGFTAFDAKSGKQLWYRQEFDQADLASNGNPEQHVAIYDGNVYLQDLLTQRIQAFDGRNGKLLWQFKVHTAKFDITAQVGFLCVSNIQDNIVEVLNEQTGKLLWQRVGVLEKLATDPNQIAIASLQENTTDIVHIVDGSTIYSIAHVRSVAELFIANNIVFFQYQAPNASTQETNTMYGIYLEAIKSNNGTLVWRRQIARVVPSAQNNTLLIVSTDNNSLFLLRADNGHTLWQHTFDSK